jgi:hypothetical protein
MGGVVLPAGLGRLGHVVVASVPRAVDPRVFIYLVGPSTPHPSRRVTLAARTTVRGRSGEFVRPSLDPRLDPRPRVGGIMFMGRTVLVWHEHGHTYAVGVVEDGSRDRAAEAAIARHLVLVAPGNSDA